MIEVGDTIYILKEDMNWSKYQITMIVDEVTTWPDYPKGRARAYIGHRPDGQYHNTWHTDSIGGKRRPVVRKTPYPDVPTEKELCTEDE